MRAPSRLLRPLIALLGAGLIVAACGGAASPSPSAAATASPSAAPASPSDAPTASPADSPAPSASGPDLSGAADALEDLDAYQMDISVQGMIPGASGLGDSVRMSAVVDRENDAFEFTISGMEGVPAGGLKVIVIEPDAWVDLGTGTYIKQPGGAAQFGASLEAFEPGALLTSIPPAALLFLNKVGDETKNGVDAAHYHVDAADSPDVAVGLGDEGVVDFWIANDGGYLVSMSAEGEVDSGGTRTPMAMTIDISRLNDPAIDITAPS